MIFYVKIINLTSKMSLIENMENNIQFQIAILEEKKEDNSNANIILEEEILESAGSINESGFVNGLNRQGFTPTKSGSEKIANLIDAFAKIATFVLGPVIKLIDDGIGMTKKKLINMFDANRENHHGDKSMGVSGIGGIISNFILSKNDNGDPTTVVVYTKHIDGPYLKATIPWAEIYTNKKYLGQIKIEPMNEQEINDFKTDRNNFISPTGTTFCFSYSEVLKNLLEEQFVSKQMDCSKLGTWWPVIFGKTQTQILLNKSNGIKPTCLKKYNYFCGSDFDYYLGKFSWSIYCFKDNGKDRFVCLDPNIAEDEQFIEILQDKKGFATIPKRVSINPRQIETADKITFTSGIRKDERLFNPLNPKEPTAEFYLNDYDSEYISERQQKDLLKKFYSEISVFRNSQRVTGFLLEGNNPNSARGGGDSLIKICLHRCEVDYQTFSKQENNIDIVHGIQQNKNANENEFPKNYTRLIKYLKDYDYQRNATYFEKVILDNKKKKAEEKRLAKVEADNIEAIRIAEYEKKVYEERKKKVEEEKQINETKLNKGNMLAELLKIVNLFIETEEQRLLRIQEEEIAALKEAKRLQKELEESERLQKELEEVERLQKEADEIAAAEEAERKQIEDEKKIVESKEWEKKAAQIIIEHLTESNYNKKTGKDFYDYVMKYINSNNN
jgi:hypothetical protein